MNRGDWSLRANGDKYCDQERESITLKQRLDNSTATVTAIAGQRGAGKSSLAQRILADCRHEKAFTLLIHSPTGYEPRDFIISIFQRICEAVLSRIDANVNTIGVSLPIKSPALQNNSTSKIRSVPAPHSLYRYAALQNRRLRLLLFLTFGAAALVLSAIVGSTLFYQPIESMIRDDISLMSARTTELRTILSDSSTPYIPDYIIRSEPDHDLFFRLLRPLIAALVDPSLTGTPISELIDNPDILSISSDYRSRLTEFLSNALLDARHLLDPETYATLSEYRPSEIYRSYVLRKLAPAAHRARAVLQSRHTTLTSVVYWTIRILFIVVTSCAVLGFVSRIGKRFFRPLVHATFNRREAHLRRRALQLSEQLAFETTRSTTAAVSTSVVNLGTRKKMASRPLSLPGITSRFNEFLGQTAEVYCRVVICLDELDKITDTKELSDLLRGIKGVLGQPGTHFILTVSEDCLCRFVAERQSERGMLESAFEDVIHLERVSIAVAEQIVEQMYGETVHGREGRSPHPSTVLLWIFGGGIPREIKRNALQVLEEGLIPKAHSIVRLWRLMLRTRLRSTRGWVMRFGGENDVSSKMLSCAEESVDMLPLCDDRIVSITSDVDVGDKIVGLWISTLLSFISNSQGGRQSLSQQLSSEGRYTYADQRQMSVMAGRVLDILMGASALRYANGSQDRGLDIGTVEKLIAIFESTPYNPTFAWTLLRRNFSDMNFPFDCRGPVGQEGVVDASADLQ